MEDGKPGVADDKLPYAVLSYAQGKGYDKHLFVDEAGSLTRLDLTKEKDMTTDFKYKFPSSVPKRQETHSGEDVGIFASGKYVYQSPKIPKHFSQSLCFQRLFFDNITLALSSIQSLQLECFML